MKKLCILGLGYIGLPTAAMFASKGHQVIGVDLNNKVIEALNNGEIIIEEPYLEDLVRDVVKSGNLTGVSTPCEADAFIIAVPTPITEDKKADMRYVESASRAIVPYLRKGNVVILESTSPPKTVENLVCPILEESGLALGTELLVAHSPERVLPGKILYELENNSRIVGGINRKSAEAVRDLYLSFVKNEIFLTDATTAEMCKLMENTYRDVNIALANELAKISESLGVNAWDVIALSNMHPRVNVHMPGPGVGGHCIAVDPWFIIEKVPSLANIINLSRETNDGMPEFVAQRSEKITAGLAGKKIVILGATYKPDVDDIRESPISYLIDILSERGAELVVCDPHVSKYSSAYDHLEESCKGSSLIILGVNHKEFKNIDFAKIKKVMTAPNVFDTRNFLDREQMELSGMNYYLLGAK